MAGLSRKLPACCCARSRELTSSSSPLSPEHACLRNASRSSGARSSTDCSRLSTCCHRSESIRRFPGQFAVEPCLGRAPVAHHGYGRYFEYLRRLFHTESPEETQLDHLRFSGIHARESLQGIVQRNQVLVPFSPKHCRIL